MLSYLGSNIRTIRTQKKMTQKELAEFIGSKKNYIWKLENDTPVDASISKIKKIAEALDVSVDALLQETPPDSLDESDLLVVEKFRRLDVARRVKVKEFIELLQ